MKLELNYKPELIHQIEKPISLVIGKQNQFGSTQLNRFSGSIQIGFLLEMKHAWTCLINLDVSWSTRTFESGKDNHFKFSTLILIVKLFSLDRRGA